MNRQEKQCFTIEEFCARWGLSRTTVYRERQDGRLKFIKVGRRRLITAEAEKEWVALSEAK